MFLLSSLLYIHRSIMRSPTSFTQRPPFHLAISVVPFLMHATLTTCSLPVQDSAPLLPPHVFTFSLSKVHTAVNKGELPSTASCCLEIWGTWLLYSELCRPSPPSLRHSHHKLSLCEILPAS